MTIQPRWVGRSSQADMLALFSVLWALAAVWHLLGNTFNAPAWTQAILVVGIVLVLVRPGAVVPMLVLAVGGLATAWGEAPIIGNHWMLAGFVNLSLLLAVTVGALRRRSQDPTDLADRFLPAARLCLLGFYAFAAFAKLNSSFLDRSVSCAVFFFRESTASVGLASVQAGGSAWIERAVIVAIVTIELSIPVLLVLRRTRALGVVLGLAFHAVLAVDHAHQFFDFSAVLFALFALFLPPSAGTWVAERLGSVRARLALRNDQLPARVHLGLVVVPTVTASLVVLDVVTPQIGVNLGWWPWQLYAGVVVGATIVFLRQRPAEAPNALRPHHGVFLVVPILVLANGLTPYLELKTGYAWNMYANLELTDGRSNHLVVRRSLPLTDEQADPIEIVATSSPALLRYAASGYALTWRQLRIFLSDHPDDSITYRRDGDLVSLRHASDDPGLVAPVPAWREKVQPFRPIDLHEPTRCMPIFGPAR